MFGITFHICYELQTKPTLTNIIIVIQLSGVQFRVKPNTELQDHTSLISDPKTLRHEVELRLFYTLLLPLLQTLH